MGISGLGGVETPVYGACNCKLRFSREKNTSESAGPKRGAEESAEKNVLDPLSYSQERKSSLNTKFLGETSRGRPGGYLGRRPGPKTFTPLLGAQENRVFCADVLDPKARTSMTRGGLRKILCRKISG